MQTDVTAADTPIECVDGLQPLAARYDLVLCDVWGVLHDGLAAFPEAGDALCRYRSGGGRVVLVSNAPRPGDVIARQLDGFGVPRAAYDAVVTSGDLTRSEVAERGQEIVYHLGPPRDVSVFADLPVRFGDIEEAGYAVCTGLFDDERETVSDYDERLRRMLARDLRMICANPDIVVERGERLIPCAGAIAARYDEIGGRSVTYGKPHRPIYEAALRTGADLLGGEVDATRILAIGDAIRTDVAGARAVGLDVLMVARGIHAAELGCREDDFVPEQALRWLATQPVRPTSLVGRLVWSRSGTLGSRTVPK